MGKRDVTIYTCDGCFASSTLGRDERPRGFTQIRIANLDSKWLCTVCYGAVEWVAKFQRVTVPPKVFKSNGRYSLRKPAD
jgi:hypothetical protein